MVVLRSKHLQNSEMFVTYEGPVHDTIWRSIRM